MSDESRSCSVTSIKSENSVVFNSDNVLYKCMSSKLPQPITELIYWTNYFKSASLMMFLIFSVYTFSNYRPHVVLCAIVFSLTAVGIAIKLCFIAFKTVQHSEIAHPYMYSQQFKYRMIFDTCLCSISLKGANIDTFGRPLGQLMSTMRDVFLVQDYVQSGKWLFASYIIYSFNGFFSFHAILYIVILSFFAVPIFYLKFEVCQLL
ncbi:hypothetical protein HZS_7765 [Henneguya salminicola]|nr:hypothetical protein HZS_7765 [Henneguya salminicola]